MMRYLFGLALCLVIFPWSWAIGENGTPAASKPGELTVVGVVTERDGSKVTLRTDESKVYTVDVESATVLLDSLPGTSMSLRLGDRIRVYGAETAPQRLRADRVHVFLSEAEAAATHMPAGTGAGPTTDDVKPLAAVGDELGAWRSRGFVTTLDYADRLITVVTSQGIYVLDVSAATIVDGNRTVSRARIGQGDAVRIWGDLVGLNRVRADRVEIIGDRSRQESAVPLSTISMKGAIIYIDYPSFVFKIKTDAGEARILVDENTFIHFRRERKAFQNLSIGDIVKIAALGNLSSGFVASEVTVVGSPR